MCYYREIPKLMKKYGLLAALLITTSDLKGTETIGGLVGGIDDLGHFYAATVTNLGSGIGNQIVGLPTKGQVLSVAINTLGYGLIGGGGLHVAYAGSIIPSSNQATSLLPELPFSEINSVAINEFGRGFIAGNALNGGQLDGYLAAVSVPSNTLIPLDFSSIQTSGFNSVSINDLGQGLVGGSVTGFPLTPFAASISPDNQITVISNLPNNIQIFSTAINDSGIGLIGGGNANSSDSPTYAAIITPSSPIASPFVGMPIGDVVNTVAINASGKGLIGVTRANASYIAITSPSSNLVTPIQLPATEILSVALNNSGQGLIGGQNSSVPFAATLSSSNVVTILNLSADVGQIDSVAINDLGQGLIGGDMENQAYVAIVSSNLVTPIPLNLSASSEILSVSVQNLLPLLSHIPTNGLSGNNLHFANYINTYASQDAFYFVPAVFTGTLSEALESAAPTRNAFSFKTVMQNSFVLTTNLATHLRDQHFMRKKGAPSTHTTSTARMEVGASEELIAWDRLPKQNNEPSEPCEKQTCSPSEKQRPYNVWFDAIGAFAKQKKQHQTPEFEPSSGGALLAFDRIVYDDTLVGCGASYLFTHIHEKKGAGHSNINQESLLVYASWDNQWLYVDGALWGGLFQTSQTRNIQMTGFAFTSESSPHGGTLTTHLEFGYNGKVYYRPKIECTLNPFGMLDWANAWQNSYRETGTGPFNAAQDSHHASLLRAELGLRAYETFFFNCGNLIVQEKGSYVNIQTYGAGQIRAFLVGSPGSFTVETLTDSQNLGVVQLLLTFAPLRPAYPMTSIFYQGEFGSSYKSHQINLEVAWNF
jgi:uncharacterized protein with beta-barrel porin domain